MEAIFLKEIYPVLFKRELISEMNGEAMQLKW